MSKINLLSSKIYNRISAGEVVERPYSVVKELVENSLDAGATKIKIEIEDGGLSSIIVTDNGCGIEKDDLKKALLPHATSKISTVKDLDNILTLGFRGEALASIASVSKLTITSKTRDEQTGNKIYSEGGEISIPEETATPNGTEIIVKNLFFNAPVRAKFLKASKSEENDIFSTLSRFVLGNPNIAFTFVSNGKTLLQSYGDGIESAFCCVYGVEVLNNCFSVSSEKNGIAISGYIGKHHYTKPNRNHQTIFLNGRYIQNQTISSAISNAYSSYLMKRQYPFYFISITMPSDAVDVNVHPNKTDVRFINNQIVYGSVYSIISKVLDGSADAVNIVVPNSLDEIKENSNLQNNNLFTNDFKYDNVTHNKPISDIFNISLSDVVNEKKEDNVKDIFEENKKYLEELERKNQQNTNEILKDNIYQEQFNIVENLSYIGQVLNTYLILENGADMFIVDQHAAHERILFDKITKSYKEGKVIKQPLLIPYVLTLSGEEYVFILDKSDFLNEMGFEIEEFGRNTFKISTVPAYLSDIDLKKFFDDVLFDLNSLKTLTISDLLFDKLAQKACKSAIKAGDKISEGDVNVLIDVLKENIGLKCPHGRPVAVKITRTEIDKWFKRII